MRLGVSRAGFTSMLSAGCIWYGGATSLFGSVCCADANQATFQRGRATAARFIFPRTGSAIFRSGSAAWMRAKRRRLRQLKSRVSAVFEPSNQKMAATCITQKDAASRAYGGVDCSATREQKNRVGVLAGVGMAGSRSRTRLFSGAAGRSDSGAGSPQVQLRALNVTTRQIAVSAKLSFPVLTASSALAISQDGEHLAYSQIDFMEADIMLLQNLP
jgi:hypothetical protein